MSLHTAVGIISSIIVTVVLQVEELALLSVTVNVTLFDPILLQSKLVLLAVTFAIPHASVEPSFISSASIVADPIAFRFIVSALHLPIGAILSSTFKIVLQVPEFPDASITVSVTVLLPIFEQSNVFGDTDSVIGPFGSVDPNPIAAISALVRL